MRAEAELAVGSWQSAVRAKRARARQAAFTLLEVLVAIAILGLGLTVILSSQTGLFASAQRGQHLTTASNLLRCKMSEIELTLAQKGFNLTDENDEGDCCDDESDGYTCSWKIERVELPPLPETDPNAEPAGSAGLEMGGLKAPPGGPGLGAPGSLGGLGASSGASAPGATGPLGALAAISASQGSSLGDKATPGSVMEQLGSTGTSGMESMVMGFVYPSLKPMLEASIRRVTVKVMWHEGTRPRDLEVTQFLTRPQEGQLGTADMLGLPGMNDAINGALGNTGTTGTNGSNGSNGSPFGNNGSILK
jgi:general secretion pathway protein I